jgi:hypothetical protein
VVGDDRYGIELFGIYQKIFQGEWERFFFGKFLFGVELFGIYQKIFQCESQGFFCFGNFFYQWPFPIFNFFSGFTWHDPISTERREHRKSDRQASFQVGHAQPVPLDAGRHAFSFGD